MNTEQKLKDVIEMSIAQTKERADTTKVLFDELLSYIRLSLVEAYKIGYTDGYDCAKIDLGKD